VEEQEVELIDYLSVIWKRKVLIVCGTLLAASGALLVSPSIPKTYEVSRTLKIGELPREMLFQGKMIESREAVMDHLRDHTVLTKGIEELQLRMGPEELANLVSIDAKTNPHVRYRVQAASPQLAWRIADWLAEHIITLHKRSFDKGMQIAEEYEAELLAKIRSLEKEIRSKNWLLERRMKGPEVDAPQTMVLQANIAEREGTLSTLRANLQSARLSLLGYANTTTIAADAPPEQPIKPKIVLNVALAGMLGLMISIFLAFLLEYVERAKSKESVVRSEESRGRTQE
jgi:capsular polysaccharide biosynthesis protein